MCMEERVNLARLPPRSHLDFCKRKSPREPNLYHYAMIANASVEHKVRHRSRGAFKLLFSSKN
ncbi:hypothetical protein CBOM_07608 [Ceraceosorus bombacis]|uniref:Uncharacterized protein n=1 Tax=Ceraceosorus bombacis TaxID=401625 RepID=A0A0P1BGI2_9BASI|nr:hypothetical protein CBOM_07608 [Ceraceosorus bombacis]